MANLKEISADRLRFNPIGAHSSGVAINNAYTPSLPAGAGKVMVQALDQNVRFTLDGTTPTATTGFQLLSGDPPVILAIGPNTQLKLIEEAASASLQLQFGE